MSLFEHVFKMRILANPLLLHGENMRRTSIPNFKFVRCVVIELQRSVTKWYFDFICIDKRMYCLSGLTVCVSECPYYYGDH